jgi:hypothetical protein
MYSDKSRELFFKRMFTAHVRTWVGSLVGVYIGKGKHPQYTDCAVERCPPKRGTWVMPHGSCFVDVFAMRSVSRAGFLRTFHGTVRTLCILARLCIRTVYTRSWMFFF